jgi:hypothetical protein
LTPLALATAAYAQPANNNCSNAINIPGAGSYGGSTGNATIDGSTTCGSSNSSPDVWFRYTHTGADKRMVLDFCNTVYDAVASVHSACPGTSANTIVCDDDGSCGVTPLLQFDVTAGTTYYVRVSGFSGDFGSYQFSVAFTDPPPPPTDGPDVVVFALQDINYYGTSGGINAYAVGTTSCNRGDAPVTWISGNNQHPVIGQNMYRVKNGRFEQIGQSWLKHGFLSVNGDSCGTCVDPPQGGAQLGVNCSDPYGWSLNGSQGTNDLGPRAHVNATTGVYIFPFENGDVANGYFDPPNPTTVIDRRLQVPVADVDPAQNAGAAYFVEGHYVTSDDAQWNNGRNNASYRRINVTSASATPSFNGGTLESQPAIYAWQSVSTGVTITPAEYDIQFASRTITSRFLIGNRVVDNGNGTWTYMYAIHNLNSDRGARSLSIPLDGVDITQGSIGFKDVAYHSGEPFSGTDWANTVGSTSIEWSTSTFAQNPNANALRWGTTYTFWFTANTAPRQGPATLGLFKSGSPEALTVNVAIPSVGRCPGDFNNDGQTDFFDYLDFASAFDAEDPAADFNGDNQVDFFDYLDFVAAFDSCAG